MDTYANMKTEVAEWLNREGFASMTTKVDTFLGMAQRKIFRECDLHALEDTATDTTANLVLPSDFMRTKLLYFVNGSGVRQVTGGSFANVIRLRASGSTSCPQKYSIQGTSLELGPEPDQEYTYYLLYYKSLPLLSDANTTNWFTDNAPELILFATLVEASLYLKDDNRAQIWQARFDDLKNKLELSDQRQDKEYGGLAVREV